jgi:hypothetical protein
MHGHTHVPLCTAVCSTAVLQQLSAVMLMQFAAVECCRPAAAVPLLQCYCCSAAVVAAAGPKPPNPTRKRGPSRLAGVWLLHTCAVVWCGDSDACTVVAHRLVCGVCKHNIVAVQHVVCLVSYWQRR